MLNLIDIIALNIHIMASVIICAYLFWSAITDASTMTIPPLSYAAVLYFTLFADVIVNQTLFGAAARIASAALLFLVFYAFAWFRDCGGGDAIVVPAIALYWGIKDTLIIILAGCMLDALLYYVKYAVAKRGRTAFDDNIPLIPGVAATHFAALLFKFL